MKNKKQIKRVYNAVVIVALVACLVYVASRFMHLGRVEFTDDAQVYRHITPIHARVGGFIKEIRFEDYQPVHQGDTLVIIDDAEYSLQLALAEAGWQGSKSGSQVVSASKNTTASNVKAARASLEEARVQLDNARRDYERYTQLLAREAVTQQQFDHVKAQYESARARFEQAQSRQQATVAVLGEQNERLEQSTAGENVAQAQVRLARLNLSYTVVVATCDGTMGRKDIHEGQLVQPGQLLARIVDANQVWVVANYRETQMRHIAVGNAVSFEADALPGITFQGRVQAIAGGTGAAFSAMPIDNATGNFVKVEQRVPVRIELNDQNRPEDVARLLAGLNVETSVKY